MNKKSITGLRALLPTDPGKVVSTLEAKLPMPDDSEDVREMKSGKYNAKEEAAENAKEKKIKKSTPKVKAKKAIIIKKIGIKKISGKMPKAMFPKMPGL